MAPAPGTRATPRGSRGAQVSPGQSEAAASDQPCKAGFAGRWSDAIWVCCTATGWESSMPLSQPVERETLHTRSIEINGYRRSDGLYDIEAHLTDTKSFGAANFDRGYIDAGEPIHDMWVRLTIDDTMHIVGCEAASDRTPYAMCPHAAPNFSRLVGLRIKAGFLREANHLVGG